MELSFLNRLGIASATTETHHGGVELLDCLERLRHEEWIELLQHVATDSVAVRRLFRFRSDQAVIDQMSEVLDQLGSRTAAQIGRAVEHLLRTPGDCSPEALVNLLHLVQIQDLAISPSILTSLVEGATVDRSVRVHAAAVVADRCPPPAEFWERRPFDRDRDFFVPALLGLARVAPDRAVRWLRHWHGAPSLSKLEVPLRAAVTKIGALGMAETLVTLPITIQSAFMEAEFADPELLAAARLLSKFATEDSAVVGALPEHMTRAAFQRLCRVDPLTRERMKKDILALPD